jgi:hypothetical protein
MLVLGESWFSVVLLLVGAPLISALYLWLRLFVLRHSGRVSDAELAKWALKEAGSHRVVELIRALRGKEPEPPET